MIRTFFRALMPLTSFILIFLVGYCEESDSTSHKQPFWKTLRNPLEFRYQRLTTSILPVCSYDPASGVEMGVMPVFSVAPKVNNEGSRYYRASSAVNHLTYSTNAWINLRSDLQYYTSKGFCYKAYTQFLSAPDYYYGIGNDTLNTTPSSFYYQYFRSAIELTKMINSQYFVGFKTDFMSTDMSKKDGMLLQGNVAGNNGGKMLGFGPVIRYDSRDNVNYPSKGSYVEVSGLWFQENNLFDYQCSIYNIDIRKYISIKGQTTLALQANATVSEGNIPFYRMPAIGGKYNLRGILNKFMYIDKNCWFAQAEIRKMLFWRLGAVAFAGAGNDFDTWNASLYTRVKAIYGGGVRVQMVPRDKLNMRIDYAWGPGGNRGLYITVREIF